VNPALFAAKSQQQPFNPAGDVFVKDAFRVVEHPLEMRHFSKVVRAWDLASTRGGGDWTVGWLMGCTPQGQIWILDEVRGQWGIDEVDEMVVATARADGRGVPIRWETGKAHLGKRENATLERLLIGYDAAGLSDLGDKQVKQNIVAPHQRAGRIVMVSSGVPADPNDDEGAIMEFVKVPGGRWDDRVDAAAVGIAYFGDIGESAIAGAADVMLAEAELAAAAQVSEALPGGHLSELFSGDF
jgi:predicted phage terminase large subunit-like protein